MYLLPSRAFSGCCSFSSGCDPGPIFSRSALGIIVPRPRAVMRGCRRQDTLPVCAAQLGEVRGQNSSFTPVSFFGADFHLDGFRYFIISIIIIFAGVRLECAAGRTCAAVSCCKSRSPHRHPLLVHLASESSQNGSSLYTGGCSGQALVPVTLKRLLTEAGWRCEDSQLVSLFLSLSLSD